MPFTVKETRSYNQPKEAVKTAVLAAISGLEGTLLKQESARIEAKFNKKILGKVLGDRTQADIDLEETADGECRVTLTIYPLDAIGRKLLFGARKGVPQTVASWIWAHVDHNLGKM
ncbi:MAG: hypothetical protein Kow0080_21650 [Candidatus Promineifilaceae bacterium]